MRLLITGATGFIGSQVAALARGDVYTERVNLLDPDESERLIARIRPTHLIHLAWFVEPAIYWTSPANMQWVEASAHLFRAFARHGGERLVGVGTAAEYDMTAGVLRENETPLTPSTVYGQCKKRLSEETAKISQESGMSWAWARMFQIYGPGEPASRFVPKAIRAALDGDLLQCADPVVRDFIYVEEAAAALLALLDSMVEGPVNIGSGKGVTLREVAHQIGARCELVASSEPPLVVADATRLREEVGFTPRVSMLQGLDLTIEWWRQRR